MSNRTAWKAALFVACLSLLNACGATEERASSEVIGAPADNVTGAAPVAGSSGSGSDASAPSEGSAGRGDLGNTLGTAGTAGAPAALSAVAKLEPFLSAVDAQGGAAGVGANAGAGAAGNGAGAGIATLSGTATFTKAAGTQVNLDIEVIGCEDGKEYAVNIHEGTSCESVETQGGHWGAPKTSTVSEAGAAGSTAADGGGAGTGGPPTSFKYRGEGIPDLKCTGTTGTTLARRNTFDRTVNWTIGTMQESDVVGHVVVVRDGTARIACGKIDQL